MRGFLLEEIVPGICERLTWVPTRLLFEFFCSLEIVGFENFERVDKNVIIASNHSSEADPIIMVACMPFFSRHLPLFFVSREKQFYKGMGWKRIIYGGALFRMWGAFEARVGLKDYAQSLRDHLTLLRHKQNVLIFPSGKRVFQGEVVKAKGGVSFLARETGLPIMPVLIEGVTRMSWGEILRRKRKIRVTFGKSLFAEDIFKDPEHAVINESRNDYEIAAAVLLEKIARLSGTPQAEPEKLH